MSRLRNIVIFLLALCPLNSLAATAEVQQVKSIASLYTAAFDRYPGGAGLNFWVESYENGHSLIAIAGSFQRSPEFSRKYGALGDRQFVEQLYQNILGRAGQADGVNFWTGHLAKGTSRASILAAFAAAPETAKKTSGIFDDMRMSNGWWLFGPDQPATGQLGLARGSAVSGVSYVTPRYRGVTAPDGSFQYQAGEPIRFTLGSTALGEVTARGLLTPFDLAGSRVLTGTQTITRALENERDPFHTLVNLSVFLQTLDSDSDPDNGIEINAEVAGLFQGVNLDVSQPWKRFRENFALRQTLKQANTRSLFSEAHAVVNPAPALRNLYDALGIDARTFAISLEQTVGGDGAVDEVSRWEYDAEGNPTWRERSDSQGMVQEIERWTYDTRGYQTRYDRQDYGGDEFETRQFDTNGKLIRETHDWNGDGEAVSIVSYQYNAKGNLTREVEDRQDEGGPETVLSLNWQYSYGAGGRLTRVKLDIFDGRSQSNSKSTTSYQYDADGKLFRVKLNGSRLDLATEALGIPDISYLQSADTYTVTYEYDTNGELTRDVRDGVASNANLSARYLVIRQYNTSGQVIHIESRLEGDNLPIPEENTISDYQYDDYGNVIREELDDNGDGTPDLVNSWYYDYDEHGKAIRQEWDEGSDGQLEQIQNWRYQYDTQGKVVREEWDESGDGTPDQIVSYTYHANGQVAREDLAIAHSSRDIVDWAYDAVGNLTGESWDYEGDGLPDAVAIYRYNAEQRKVERLFDEAVDEMPDQVDTRYYDARGNLTRQEADENGDGAPDRIYKWQYNASGNPTRFDVGENSDGAVEASLVSWFYDARGKLMRNEINCHHYFVFPLCFLPQEDLADTVVSEFDAHGRLTQIVFGVDGDGSTDAKVRYTYDANGNLLRESIDRDADGMPDEIVSYAYDADGRLLREVTDSGADGIPDYIGNFDYDANGNLIRKARDREADGATDELVNYEYEATGWGHIFSLQPGENAWDPGNSPGVAY